MKRSAPMSLLLHSKAASAGPPAAPNSQAVPVQSAGGAG
jgi:hypothetical protein